TPPWVVARLVSQRAVIVAIGNTIGLFSASRSISPIPLYSNAAKSFFLSPRALRQIASHSIAREIFLIRGNTLNHLSRNRSLITHCSDAVTHGGFLLEHNQNYTTAYDCFLRMN